MPAIMPLPAAPAIRIVQVDPRYIEARASAPMGARVLITRDDVAIDANYFFNAYPLGRIVDRGRALPSMPLPKGKHERPCLVIAAGRAQIVVGPDAPRDRGGHAPAKDGRDLSRVTLIQAGPLLIKDGKRAADRGGFRRDVFRRTMRTAVGVTREGKILLIYCHSATIDQVANYLLRYGAVDAMGLDSGSSASLYIKGRWYGNPRPKTLLRFCTRSNP